MNKMREEMANRFLAALKEDVIPWHKEWSSLSARPYNAVSQSSYHGMNSFWLAYCQAESGYQDPRWCTFKQASEKGWQIRKGEKGTKIEFWSLYDTETKKTLVRDQEEQLRNTLGMEEFYKRVRPTVSVYTVFNGEQIEGIPEIEIERHMLDEKMLLEMRNALLKNMAVGFQEGKEEAFYRPDEDCIYMPDIERFENEYAYMSILLHEAGHATGHESRMNREIRNTFGSAEYAKEELRAEIASAFTAQALNLPDIDSAPMENHKAYVQNWIEILENNPDELFHAIRDAEKISDYLIEEGGFKRTEIQVREKKTEHSKTEAVAEKDRVTILGYYTRGDGTQFIHYTEAGKEFLTSGVHRWSTGIENTISTLKQVAHLPDRDNMLMYLEREQADSAITQYMNQMVGEISFIQNGRIGEMIPYTSSADYIKAVKEEIEYRSSSGFQYKTFTHDPEVKKNIDDIVYDLYGEENPHDLNYYQQKQREEELKRQHETRKHSGRVR